MSKAVLIINNFRLSPGKYSVAVSETLKDCLEQEGVKVILSSGKINKGVMLLGMLASIIKYRNTCDLALINVFSGKAFIWAYLSAQLCRFLKKPYFLYFHGGNLPFFAKTKANLIKSIACKSSGTIAPSNYLKDKLADAGISIKKVISNFIVLRNYTYKLRTEILPKMFWLRAYHSIYNPTMALEVLCSLKKQYPQATLTMAGPDKGGLRKAKALAEQLGIDKSVRFLEFVSKEKINLLGLEHDIFLNTARIDNMPVTVLEAMAMGLPTVSTDVGGIRYLLENEKDSLLVPDNEPAIMTEAVKKLLADSRLTETLSSNGRKKVMEFTWDKVRHSWLEILDLPC